MRGRLPFALGASLIGAIAAGGAAVAGALAPSIGPLDIGEGVFRKRGKGQANKRGKGAARRHGAKLRPNRLHVGKRARRKHRRAR